MDNPTQALVVVTYKGSPWLQECLDSLTECKYPVHICWSQNGAFEAEGLYYAEKHNLPSVILLHDSMRIKDHAILDMVKDKENIKIAPQMCLGKFSAPYDLPQKPTNKREAIDFECKWYMGKNWEIVCPDLIDGNTFEEKNGRTNMVLENQYIKKYKGTWQ